ncbi:glycosyltransferase family 4 protein [uncultured Phascolarctobacterium sp.]|uniref:glycosyltransferase family 4 protein n=1 Tax=Phascolarctobacterium sp. TaxID=2049039 RepID=UPI0025E5182F|nr:glycosyltransferase family 4 protein [uncultured Phascolarctobacterium sp.]
MKIVNVEDFFHPDAGYQLNILSKYMSKMGHKVTIITAELDKIPEELTRFFERDSINEKDKEYQRKYDVKIVRIPTKAYISGRVIFSNELFHLIEKEEPDAVFIHDNDTWTGIKYLLNLKKMKYPLIMDNHMLEMASRNPLRKLFRYIYRKFITPIIIKNNVPIIRTQDDVYVEKCLGIPLSYAPFISVGTDTTLFYQNEIEKKLFRKKYDINDDELVMLYAGKLDESKGGMLLAQALYEKIEVSRKLTFLIAGNTIGDYGEKVEALLKRSSNKIVRLPTQKYLDLPKLYQASDCAIFPKQCSLSFFDVQACGLPVILEDNVINKSRSAYGNAIMFSEGNVEALRACIKKICEMPECQFYAMKKNSIEFVINNFDYKKIADEYMYIIEKTVEKYNCIAKQ